MRYVSIFKTDCKILSSVTHHSKKMTKLHAVTSTTTNPVSTHPIIWRKSAACIVQTAIWLTAAKNWMSGHFLWTLIRQVYFHKCRDLHSRSTNVRTKRMWKKIFCKKMKSKCQNKTMDAHLWVTNINTLTYCNTFMKEKKKKKQNKLNDFLWKPAGNHVLAN